MSKRNSLLYKDMTQDEKDVFNYKLEELYEKIDLYYESITNIRAKIRQLEKMSQHPNYLKSMETIFETDEELN